MCSTSMSSGCACAMAQSTSSDNVFLEARRGFLASLSEPEKSAFKTCSSSAALIADVDRLVQRGPQNSQWATPLNRLKDWNDRLGCYFKVIDTFIQSNPEIAAIVWGAIRLVLQLASNFGSFFNKLLDVLKKLGQKLPRYEEILKCSPNAISREFERSLTSLYHDLFEFFTAVARVFRRKNGELRRVIFVAANVTFRPFEAQYGAFLEKIQHHCDMLAEEQALIQTKLLAQTFVQQSEGLEKQEAHQRDQEHRQRDQEQRQRDIEKSYRKLVQRLDELQSREQLHDIKKGIKEWLNPPTASHINTALDATRNVRVEGTGDWIFRNKDFASWVSEEASVAATQFQNTLWVRGNPGSGKTILAAWTLHSLRGNQGDGCDSTLTIPYFFSYIYQETRDPRTVWSLSLWYILDHCYGNLDVLDAFSLAKRASSNTYALVVELIELFHLVAQRLPRLILLLDGVDESSDPESLAASVGSILHGTKAKAILFSRPNIAILQRNAGGLLRVIDMTPNTVDSDIRRLLKTRLEQFEEGWLPENYSTPWAISHLAQSAKGMILWARLMLDFLTQLHDADARAEAIMTLTQHEDLVSMYLRILRLISGKSLIERNMVKRVILYLSFAHSHLSAKALWEVVIACDKPSASPGTQIRYSPDTEALEWFHSSILIRCASLVERRGDGYAFIHQSVLEFFWAGVDQSNPGFELDQAVSQFLDPPPIRHQQIVVDCLTYLAKRLHSGPLSGDSRVKIESQRVEDCLPFAAYAAVKWPIHLQLAAEALTTTSQSALSYPLAQSYRNLFEALLMFTANKLAVMTWIELDYTVSHGFEHLDGIQDRYTAVESLIRDLPLLHQLRDNATTVHSFFTNMKDLEFQWGSKLRARPNTIWIDVTVWFESRFLQKTAAVEVYSMKPSSPNSQGLATEPLVVVSKESSDKRFNAVLSIWPTRGFEDMWNKKSKTPRFGRGDINSWVALFEKHDKQHDNPRKIFQVSVPLEPIDVRRHLDTSLILMRQSLNGSKSSSMLSLSFPTAIAGDLDTFLILDNAYGIEITDNGTTEKPQVRCYSLPGADGEMFGVKQVAGSSLSLGLAVTYSYQISDDGRYILRQQQKCLTTLGVTKEPVTFALSVFGNDSDRESYVLLGHYGSQESMEQLSHCSFHPVYPLVLFCSKGLGVPHTIRLWAFGPNFATPGEDHASGSSDLATSGVVSTPIPSKSQSGVAALFFSACGKHVTLQPSLNHRPEVYSLENDHAYLRAMQVAGSSAALEETSRSISTWNGASLMLPAHGVQAGRSWMEGQSMSRLTFAGTTRNALQVVQSAKGGVDISQDILSFPDSWETLDDTIDASVEPSKTSANHLDITINRSSRNWYTAGHQTGRIEPHLARKHVGAVLPAEATRLSKGKRKRVDSVLTGTTLGIEYRPDVPSKQPKLLESAGCSGSLDFEED